MTGVAYLDLEFSMFFMFLLYFLYDFIIKQFAEIISTLPKIACHMGSYSVTCYNAAMNFPPLPQPKLVLDLASSNRCKAELTCTTAMALIA